MCVCLAVHTGVMIEAASVAGGLGKRRSEQTEGRLPTHQTLRLQGYDRQLVSFPDPHTRWSGHETRPPTHQWRCGSHTQGDVTPIDSIVTAATTVGEWSTINATQNVQSMVKNVQAQHGTTGYICAVNSRKLARSMVKPLKRAGQSFDQ